METLYEYIYHCTKSVSEDVHVSTTNPTKTTLYFSRTVAHRLIKMAMLKWIMFEMERDINEDRQRTPSPSQEPPLIEVSSVERGFKSKDQAQKLAEGFYEAICETLSSEKETTAAHPICKFLNTDNFTFIVGGTATTGLEQWLPFHNKYGKMIKKATSVNVHIKSWMSNSCVVQYEHHLTFINNQQYTVHGHTVFVVKNDKKIKYVIETPCYDDLNAMNPIIASILNIPKEKMVSGLGLKSKEEAQELAANFNVTKLASVITTDDNDPVMKLIDINNFSMISGNNIMTDIQEFTKFHNSYIRMIKKANSFVKVEEWMANSIVCSIQLNLTFIDDQECTIRGYSIIVVGIDKKIKYAVESPRSGHNQKMNAIIDSIMNVDEY